MGYSICSWEKKPCHLTSDRSVDTFNKIFASNSSFHFEEVSQVQVQNIDEKLKNGEATDFCFYNQGQFEYNNITIHKTYKSMFDDRPFSAMFESL